MKKPINNSLLIYIDGAARGNPGPAGVGVVIEDANKRVIKKINRYIGNATNNVAEYTAFMAALDEARALSARDITINTDSELLAKQLGGEYKVKNPVLKGFYERIIRVLDNFDKVVINNIPRQENKGADRLANKAIDDAAKVRAGKSFILKSR
jgi:ribonuclease HI